MRQRFLLLAGLALVLILCLPALAAAQVMFIDTFDANPVLSATQAPGVWYTDRYAPAAFESAFFDGGNRLKHSISVNDNAVNRPASYVATFYNTQGRKFDLNNPVGTSITADLYIGADWQTSHRRADMWATMADAADAISAYPIIGFANTTGSNPTWRVYNIVTGEWINLAPPTGFTYGAWYRLRTELTGSAMKYYVNDELVYTGPTEGSVKFLNIIIQAYNFGDPALADEQEAYESYDVYWDNIGATSFIKNVTQSTWHPTLQTAVDAAAPGDVIELAAGTWPLPAYTNVNKANLTIQGTGSAATILEVSGTGDRLGIFANGVTVKDLAIQKTDKAGGQDIIRVAASDFTLKNTVVSGQFVIGDPEVSRAMVFNAGAFTGILIEGNTFHSLRQPAYISGTHAGLIKNNYTYGTKGWVLEGGNLTFEGNTWGSGAGVNVYDIAIISAMPAAYYTDIVAMSNANNEAVIEDQRVSPAVLSVVYVDAATAFSSDLGGKFHPYATITPAIMRVVTGGKIYVAPGTYNESVAITKRLTLDGAGSGSDPAANTVITGPGSGNGITTVAGASAASRLLIKDVRVTGFFNGVYASSYMTLDNVAITGNSNAGIEMNPLTDLVITTCKSDGNKIGMRAGTAANLENVTVTNSSFNGNSAQGWFIAAQSTMDGSTFSGVTVTNCTFNDNLQKGIYVEKLENAVFDGITVTNSGTDPAYGFNNGIDINLKYGTYQNIQILNSTITGCGATGTATDVTNPAAVAIKPRDDGSYASTPATLDNVVIDNTTITGPQNALRLGEFGKVNAGPTNVVIKNSTIEGTAQYHIINRTSADVLANEANTFTGSATVDQIEAKVMHGLDDAALGVVNFGQFAMTPSEVWVDDSWAGTVPGTPVNGHWFGTNAFATIQEAINAVVSPGKVNIAAGSYNEAVNVNKNALVIRGSGAAAVIVSAPSNAVDVLTLAGSGLQVSGLTLTGGRNGIYGTTSNGRLLAMTVNGNAQNGIQLIDADNNLLQGLTVSGQAAGAGIRLTGARQNTVSGNTIQGNGTNVLVEINAARHATGNIIQGNTLLDPGVWSVNVTDAALTTAVNFNVFSTTTGSDKYVANSDPAMLNAQYNWFGGENPPQASDFSGNVNYANHYATDPTVSIFPVTHYMPQSSTVNVSVMALIPNGTTVKGIDVNMSWDSELYVQDNGDPLEGPFFSNAGSSFYEFIKPTGSSLRVNQSLLASGGVSGGTIPYLNVLFTQAFTSGTTDGTTLVTLNSVQMRDPANTPLTVNLDPDPTPQATLIVDGSAPVVTVAIDNLTNAWTDLFLKNGDGIAVTATVADANPLTAGDITANLNGFYNGTGHAADNPSSYTGTAATWPAVVSAVCSPADGAITVTVTATDVLGNVGTGTKTITADNTKPVALTNFRATPGHKKVNLTWDDPSGTDANYHGVVVRYATWTGYPQYAGAEPVFPVAETAGDGQAAFVTGATFAAAHSFTNPDRGIYYYRGFVVDKAGNYAGPNGSGNDADRSTNYILGDLGSGPGNIGDSPYDGAVNFQDLSLFSYLYFEPDANAPGWPYAAAQEADFGPTVNNKTYGAGSRFGIPDPSGTVEFEDLMIFSMNYGYTAPPKIALPASSDRAAAFAVNLAGRSAGANTYDVTVHLGNDGRAVKGASVLVAFDPAVVKVAGVTRGDLFGSEVQAFYGHRVDEKAVQIDAAVLGKDIAVEHSGDLATIHFTVLKQGDAGVRIENADVRNAANTEMSIEAGAKVAEVPATFDLAQNYPNPFNPSTTIRYQVAAPVQVDVVVYNVLGERIVTLVNEVQAPGYYTMEWNGRDSRNQTVPSGLYFYTMRAGDFSSVKKMMLMK